MQNAKTHLISGVGICILIYISTYFIMKKTDLVSLLFFGAIGSILPDWDKAFCNNSQHRHYLYHSSVPAIVFIFYPIFFATIECPVRIFDFFYFSLALGLHLFFDWKPGKEGKVLGYLIWKKKGDKMSAKNTDLYLWINGAICFCLSLVAILYIYFRF